MNRGHLPPPLISVVTVVLNGAATLERALKSVLDQEFDDLEYVVIDGGSIDGSGEVIRKYEAPLGHTLKCVTDQEIKDHEYGVIDGGSTDGSVEVIRKYEARLGYWRSEPD